MRKPGRVQVGLIVIGSLVAMSGVLIATSGGKAAAEGVKSSSTNPTAIDSTSAEEYAEGVVDILLGDTITATGEGVTVKGTTVCITAAGVYRLSGTLNMGRIDIDAKGKVYLELDGADITSDSGPALNVTDAKRVTLTLAAGTTNSLADTPGDGASEAALFTNDTLVINGAGTLVVTGNNEEGIASDDDIIVNSGTVKVGAVDDGLNAHDDITINGGEVSVLAGGDGLDSNGTININGGVVVAFGGSSGSNAGLDALGALTITGGTVIAGGGTTTLPGGESSQCSLLVGSRVDQRAGTSLRIGRNGEEILEFSPQTNYRDVLVSLGSLIDGATYDVWLGDAGETAFSVTAAICPIRVDYR